MAREQIPITPEVLKWARERAGFSLEEAQADFSKIEKWEAGEAFPTYHQLERLSNKFKVPVAVFFFPKPPDVPPIRNSFRTLPDARFNQLPREIRFLLRKAKVFQINLSELNDEMNPAERFILNDLRFTQDMDIIAMARRVRDYLNISLKTQRGWANSDVAFEAWREVLEYHGVAVFKDAFGNDFFSGFCMYDETFPIIYVNNSSSRTRQIFTLFHELAHLLFHTSGIDTHDGEPGEDLSPSGRRIEVICNRFAAEFLLPMSRFKKDIRGQTPNEETAKLLADRYHISRESIFRRFLDSNLIAADEYPNFVQTGEERRQGRGGDYYWTKITYLGTNYIDLAFSRYHQNRISEPELADYLNTKVKNLPQLENYFFRKIL